MDDLMSDLTDALLSDERDVDSTFAAYPDVARHEADALLNVARALRSNLTPVEPSAQFKAALRRDLVGEPQRNLLQRIQALPARVHFTAIFAAVATLLGWFVSRRRNRNVPEAAEAKRMTH
jgi:hypothetical protein